jgi:hypothetical protein
MTNEEKFKEVFGFDIDIYACVGDVCTECPLHDCKHSSEECTYSIREAWWSNEYKGSAK